MSNGSTQSATPITGEDEQMRPGQWHCLRPRTNHPLASNFRKGNHKYQNQYCQPDKEVPGLLAGLNADYSTLPHQQFVGRLILRQ